ncbi:MAG: S49 family peptidase, partial [Proteobacteria bacterium]|nr:S49 family peptidase [Pseudomonadota bacterium]
MRIHLIIILIAGFIIINGCGAPNIKLFTDASAPLQEFTLQGKEKGKVLIIPVRGIISDNTKKGMLYDMPSMVQEIVSQLRMAEKDEEVRAVLLKIDSPGGSTTASDILYHEIMAYKKRTGTKVVAAMMDIATSGGYYVSLPSDLIIAHPTTITGSIGVIFIRPELINIMGKIG